MPRFRQFLLMVCLIGTGLALPNPAPAGGSPVWNSIDGWEIRVDTLLYHSCYLTTEYDEGTVLRIGLIKNHKQAYVILANLFWGHLEAGKDYEMSLRFDKEPPWNGTATVIRMGQARAKVLKLMITDPVFLDEFSRKHEMAVTLRGRPVAILSLSSSQAAVRELINCQNGVDALLEALEKPAPSNPPPPHSQDRIDS